MILLVKMIFGSHLYGTDTPSSDKDFKGVYLPSKREVYTGSIAKSIQESTGSKDGKNTSEDTDSEIYSLQYFIKLAMEGQTVAMDMLHAPADKWLTYHPLWIELVHMRPLFYTRNLHSFVGYARRQAAKYGIKGSRLSAAKEVMKFLASHGRVRMRDIWHMLWEGEHIHLTHNGVHRLWQVCGKYIPESGWSDEAYTMLEKFYLEYGDRAKQAEENKGIDWKAVSHALRAGYQAKHIFQDGYYSYPLPETPYIKEVKLGQRDYLTDVAPTLEGLMDELELLSKVSNLPLEVDREEVENWLVEKLDHVYSAT